MTMQLASDVGRSGWPEDVAIVQALLANIDEPGGKRFWDRRIDGRPSVELAAAVEAFQRRWLGAAGAVGASELGIVRPGSRTWQTLCAQFPSTWGELRAAAGNPVLLYAMKNPGVLASGTADRLRRGTTAPERMIGHRLRLELARAVEKLATAAGVGLALARTALAGDRVAMWFEPVGLSVLDDVGRPQSMDGRLRDVPDAFWRRVDDVVTGQAAVGATGKGGYQPIDGLPSLRDGSLDATLFDRFGIDPSAIRGDTRPALAALTLIARIDRLSPPAHDELLQLFEIVAADDPGTARVLRERRDAASRGANRQPEAVGAGPSPFEQAVDQLLRTTSRNYQSSQFAELQSLASNLNLPDQWEAYWFRFKELVGNRKPWDIKREFPQWARDPVDGVEYGSDIWGNIHYGYLGKAAGLRELIMLRGAGWAQYTTHENNDLNWVELGAFAVRELFSTYDDPKDQAAIRLGVALWDEHRFPIPRGALLHTLRRQKSTLNTR